MRVATADATHRDALVRVHHSASVAAYATIFPPGALWDAERLGAAWDEHLADPTAVVLAGFDGDTVVGAAVARPQGRSSDPGTAELVRLYVAPELWGRGVGGLLHDGAVELARRFGATRILLWVLERNTGAREFYERRGWRLEGRVADVHAGVREVAYVLTLTAEP